MINLFPSCIEIDKGNIFLVKQNLQKKLLHLQVWFSTKKKVVEANETNHKSQTLNRRTKQSKITQPHVGISLILQSVHHFMAIWITKNLRPTFNGK